MPLQVRAQIVDLHQDRPRSGERFLVDSNVWYWLGYSKAALNGKAYQLREYPRYAADVVNEGGTLYRTAFALAETAHIIERTEYEIFTRLAPGTTLKQFRHDSPTDRATVIAEVHSMWSVVKNMSSHLQVMTTESFTQSLLNEISAAEIDSHDGILADLIKRNNLTGIISDDADLATVGNVTVFTANRTALREAAAQGMLMTR